MSIDFLGIGVPKSGSTWLYHSLSQIQEFSLPPVKEMHYFDRSHSYPSSNYLSETLAIHRLKHKTYLLDATKKIASSIKQKKWNHTSFYLKWYFSNLSDEWYLSLFNNFDGFTGEVTPNYSILSKEDIKRIHSIAPKVKLVLILRNPVHRAWSNYRDQNRRNRNFSIENIEESTIIEFMESEKQELLSDYIRTIDNFLSVFESNQILICFYDAIVDTPAILINEIVKFITNDASISLSHTTFTQLVNKSPKINCPPNIENYLKKKYYTQIKTLAESHGGYFSKWLMDTYGEESTNQSKITSSIHL